MHADVLTARRSRMSQLFKVGDRVVAKHHRRYEPGEITAVVRLSELDATTVPLYRIAFPAYELHLTADEITTDPGPAGRMRG